LPELLPHLLINPSTEVIKEVEAALEDLHELSKDGSKGFATAAEVTIASVRMLTQGDISEDTIADTTSALRVLAREAEQSDCELS
jgi:hypothetical protein